MIEKLEIDQMAKELEVGHADIQKDYVFGWLLYGLFTRSTLKDSIFLKGGNALRKAYFPQTRYSADLDFGTLGHLAQEALHAEVQKVCTFIQDRAGVTFDMERTLVKDKFAGGTPTPDLQVYEVRV